MANLLRQLENNESILLMYLAGELPPEERAEVEQMLTADAGLRASLEKLRAAQDAFDSGMAALDRRTRLPAPETAAVRRVVQDIHQWQARRLANPPKAPAAPTLRYPWWAYPMAAAASIVIAFLVWWGNTDRTTVRYADSGPRYEDVEYVQTDADLLAALLTLGGSPELPMDRSSVVDPTDYAVLMLIDEPGTAADTPSEGDNLEPPEFGIDINDLYL